MQKSKSLNLRASAAKEEAQQARARAQAAMYMDMAEYAHKFADGFYGRAMRQRPGLEL